MNKKKSKELREKANIEWVKLNPAMRKLFTEKQMYKQIKKEYKAK